MEPGVLGSTRMGSRSSTRHGPASSVFQGRVRRWNKSWAPVATPLSPTPTSAAACRVFLYKWAPVAVPSTNGTKESTPEEPTPTKPPRFLPVSVVQQQKNEEALKAAEEAEVLARLQQEAEAVTNATEITEVAVATDSRQDIEMGGARPEEVDNESVNVTEPGDQGVQGDEQANRDELAASLQNESIAPQKPEAASMDVVQS